MHPVVVGQLGVEGDPQDTSLAHGHRRVADACEDFDAWTDGADARRADEDAAQWRVGPGVDTGASNESVCRP